MNLFEPEIKTPKSKKEKKKEKHESEYSEEYRKKAQDKWSAWKESLSVHCRDAVRLSLKREQRQIESLCRIPVKVDQVRSNVALQTDGAVQDSAPRSPLCKIWHLVQLLAMLLSLRWDFPSQLSTHTPRSSLFCSFPRTTDLLMEAAIGFIWTMGTYASHFHKNDGQILTEITDPSQANWITVHAETCKMMIPEVQRCWSRFLMLQPDLKGNLPRMRLLQTNSSFGQKLLEQIPVTDDDQITFQTYCNAVSWLSKSSLEIKLKGLYQTLSSGMIYKEQLQDLLCDLYPMESRSAINELSALFLKEVDKSNQGYITEDMFVAWVQTLPQEIVESILNFPIIPPNLILTEPSVSYLTIAAVDQDKQRLDDEQLFRVATEMSTRKRNWKLLASKLGVLEKDCFHLEHQNPEVRNQSLKMLQIWLRRCQEAPLPILQAALRESGNVDICNEVFHLSF